MSPIQEALILVDCETVSQTFYDAVMVGCGLAGAIAAKELSQPGKKVLILEAGQAKHLTLAGFQSYIDTFYSATGKGRMFLGLNKRIKPLFPARKPIQKDSYGLGLVLTHLAQKALDMGLGANPLQSL
jgi:hypothetical protein